jgi:hypothetical protein
MNNLIKANQERYSASEFKRPREFVVISYSPFIRHEWQADCNKSHSVIYAYSDTLPHNHGYSSDSIQNTRSKLMLEEERDWSDSTLIAV